jgi:hypothetical protein
MTAVIQDDVDNWWDAGHAIREEQVPLLEVAQLAGVIAMPEHQKDIGGHTEDLCVVSMVLQAYKSWLAQSESAIMNHWIKTP